MIKLLKKYRLEVIFISILILFFIAYFKFNDSAVFLFLQNSSSHLMLRFSKYGLIGVSLASFIGNSSVIVQIPYYLVVFLASINAASFWDVFWIGLVTGIGAGLGEAVAYLVGRGISHVALSKLRRSSLFRFLEKIVHEKEKFVPTLVFLFALTPLPDDTLLLPLGMVKYNFKKLILPVFLGKIVLGWGLAFGFIYFTQNLSKYTSIEPSLDLPFILMFLFLKLIVYQTLKYRKHLKG